MLSQLEMFTVPATQASIEKSRYIKFYPITSLDSAGPIEFRIVTSDTEYLDVSNIFLYTKNRILDGAGKEIPETVEDGGGAQHFNTNSIVFPINAFHSTRFKSLEVQLNNTTINELDALYPYRSYLQTLLSFNEGVKENTLQSILWAKDKLPDGNFQGFDQRTKRDLGKGANTGGFMRFRATAFSMPFEMMGRLHADLLFQERYLPGNCELKLRLHRADPQFALMARSSVNGFTIAIDSAVLWVRCVDVAPAIREAHVKAALHNTYKFPIRKMKTLYFTFSQGRQDLSVYNVVTGRLPKRLICGLVKSTAFHGNYGESPFNFQHFNVTNVTARLNGQAYPCDSGIQTDFNSGNFIQGFWSLMQATGMFSSNTDLDIGLWKDYSEGNCLFGFDFSPEMESASSPHFDLVREGKLDLEIKLATPCAHPVTLIVLMEYDHLIEMSHDGDIISEP